MSKHAHLPYGPYEKWFKRMLDLFCSILALILLSPVFLVIAVMIRVKLGSPVLFTQERPGMHEKIFKLYKFRTMTNKRGTDGELLPDKDRLTDFGKWIRSTSLDELPELINIIKGDMSLIGPRPLLVQYLPYYTESERHRHDVRPGLTGLAQVSGRNQIKWDERLAKDVEYVDKITLFGDLIIILKTVKNVLLKADIATDTVSVEPYLDVERKKDV